MWGRRGLRNKRRGECFSTKAHMISLVGETVCFEEQVRKSCVKAVCGTYQEQLEERFTKLFVSINGKISFVFHH